MERYICALLPPLPFADDDLHMDTCQLNHLFGVVKEVRLSRAEDDKETGGGEEVGRRVVWGSDGAGTSVTVTQAQTATVLLLAYRCE